MIDLLNNTSYLNLKPVCEEALDLAAHSYELMQLLADLPGQKGNV
jgi:hypothetical protein